MFLIFQRYFLINSLIVEHFKQSEENLYRKTYFYSLPHFYLDSKQTVCVAARIRANGSYHLETHFCNESFKALCHKLEHVNGMFIVS